MRTFRFTFSLIWLLIGTARSAEAQFCDSPIRAEGFAKLGNYVYFIVSDAEFTSTSLYRSNGTANSAELVRPLPSEFFTDFVISNEVGGLFYFYAMAETGGVHLWRSDGTSDGTWPLKDLNSSDSGYADLVYSFASLGSQLYFVADKNLYKTNGTVAGTTQVTDLRISKHASIVSNSGYVYLAAEGNGTGLELWRSDGTDEGTSLIKDLVPGPASSNPGRFTAVGETVYFTTNVDGYQELWKTDGTQGGTTKVSTQAVMNYFYFVSTGEKLFYMAQTSESLIELWVTSPLTSPTRVQTVGGDPYAYDLTAPTALADGTIVFGGWEGPVRGLMKSDGSTSGVQMIRESNYLWKLSSHPLSEAGGFAYFSAVTQEHGHEIWRSDGTLEGTTRITDFNPEKETSNFSFMRTFHDEIYLVFASKYGDFPCRLDGATGELTTLTCPRPTDAVISEWRNFE